MAKNNHDTASGEDSILASVVSVSMLRKLYATSQTFR